MREILEAVPCATHTQRATGFVLLRVPEDRYVNVEDLVTVVEKSMSGQTYAILKRPAEASVVELGNRRAMLALQAYCYRIRKYIGSYFVALGGLDALVFTAGVGEGSSGLKFDILE